MLILYIKILRARWVCFNVKFKFMGVVGINGGIYN